MKEWFASAQLSAYSTSTFTAYSPDLGESHSNDHDKAIMYSIYPPKKNYDKYGPLNVHIFSAPCQKELMSHYTVPQITPIEENSDSWVRGNPAPLEKLDCFVGLLWAWVHPSLMWLSNVLIGATQKPQGNIPQLSFTLFKFHCGSLVANSITDGFYTSATCFLPRHSFTYFGFSIWYVVRDRLSDHQTEARCT